MFARFVREEVAVLQFGLRGYSVKRSSHRHVGLDLTAGCNTTLHTWQFRNVHPPNVDFFLPITTLPEILVVFKCEAATLVYAAHWRYVCREPPYSNESGCSRRLMQPRTIYWLDGLADSDALLRFDMTKIGR